jgi:flagellar biosynthesis protein FlhF
VNYRKSFYAHSVEAALALARKEFGDEAYLLDSRSSRPEQRHLGAFEVIVESDASTSETAAGSVPAAQVARRDPAPGWADLAAQVERLKEELRRTAELLYRPAGLDALLQTHPALRESAVRLAAAELPPASALEILRAAAARLDSEPDAMPGVTAPHARASEAAAAELAARLECGRSALHAGRRATVALVGPAGAGKTTTLVKIAARYGVTRGVPALLVSTDTCRVGGADQLAAYAAILGLPFVAVDTPAALVGTLEEHARKSLILIDTPGFSPADRQFAADWADLLGTYPNLETHLVLAATQRLADLRQTMRAWARFRPAHIILTRLDETSSFGAALGGVIEAERPVSFTSGGQSVPEDLQAPDSRQLAALLLPAAERMLAAA